MKNCPKCNSDKIIPNGMVLDTGQAAEGYLQVAVDENPDAVFFKSRAKSQIRVSICGHCGYLEFYAESPGIMYQTYQNMLKNK